MVPLALTVAVPLGAQWVEEQQKRILAEGVALTPHQAFDAHLAGVKDPGKVRLLKTDFIPVSEDPILSKANEVVWFGVAGYCRDYLWLRDLHSGRSVG